MVFCVNAELAFTSAARRNQVLNAANTDRQGRSRYGTDQLEARANKVGANGIYVILRFVAAADRDAFVANLLTIAVGQLAPVAGSWYRLHDCVHDEGGNCGAGVRTVF